MNRRVEWNPRSDEWVTAVVLRYGGEHDDMWRIRVEETQQVLLVDPRHVRDIRDGDPA